MLMKDVDLGEPTSFSWPCLFGLYSTRMSNKQGYCRTITEICSNPRFLPELRKTYQFPRNRMRIFSSWSYDMEGHAKKCVERYCELAKRNNSTVYTKSQRHALMTHHFKEEEMGTSWIIVNSLLTNCFWNVYILARIGRPDILWSVNKTCPCSSKMDSKIVTNVLARLLSYIHHTRGIQDNIALWKTQHNNAE